MVNESAPVTSSDRASPKSVTVPVVGGTLARTTVPVACTRIRARNAYGADPTDRETNAGASGGSRSSNRSPLGRGATIRSTLKERQALRSTSRATKYQRRPVGTRRYGSTRRRLPRPRPST